MLILSFISTSLLVFLIPLESVLQVFNNLKDRCRSEQAKGMELLNALSRYNQRLELSETSDYKFYKDIIYNIIKLRRDFGANTSKSFLKLKNSLTHDLQIQRKLSSVISQTYLQFALACIMTIFITIFASEMIELKLDKVFICVTLVVNGLGTAIFYCSSRRYSRHLVEPISKTIQSFLVFKLSYDAGVSINRVISISGINQFCDSSDQFTKEVYDRLAALVDARLLDGSEIRDDIEILETSIWNEYEALNIKLAQRIKIIKFVCLILFFFIPYIGSFFRLLQNMNL